MNTLTLEKYLKYLIKMSAIYFSALAYFIYECILSMTHES